MTLSKKCIGATVAVLLTVMLITIPFTAFAWDGDTEGNNETNNSQSITNSSSGSVAVQGWIGTFDGEEDPDRPNPPSEAWINVKVPTTALFGSLASDNKNVYSPEYTIYNYSARDVNITPERFEVGTEPSQLSGLHLDLNFTSPVSKSVVLRNASDQFLGNGIADAQTVALRSGSEANPSTAEFNLSGQLGESFIYPTEGAPYLPTYTLIFSFESVEPESVS